MALLAAIVIAPPSSLLRPDECQVDLLAYHSVATPLALAGTEAAPTLIARARAISVGAASVPASARGVATEWYARRSTWHSSGRNSEDGGAITMAARSAICAYSKRMRERGTSSFFMLEHADSRRPPPSRTHRQELATKKSRGNDAKPAADAVCLFNFD